MSLTPEQIQEIRERGEKATPGPWMVERAIRTEILCETENYVVAETNNQNFDELNEEDAEFIAHARTDIPLLLEEIERLNQEVKYCRTGWGACQDIKMDLFDALTYQRQENQRLQQENERYKQALEAQSKNDQINELLSLGVEMRKENHQLRKALEFSKNLHEGRTQVNKLLEEMFLKTYRENQLLKQEIGERKQALEIIKQRYEKEWTYEAGTGEVVEEIIQILKSGVDV